MKVIMSKNSAELWVESDVDNDCLHSAIQVLIDEGFKPVIYHSGKEELLSLTQQLLFHAAHQSAQPIQNAQTKKNRHST